jgi:hypothetical protein
MYSALYESTPDRHELPHAYLILIRFHVVLLALVLWAIGTSAPGSWLAARPPLEAPAQVQAAHP